MIARRVRASTCIPGTRPARTAPSAATCTT